MIQDFPASEPQELQPKDMARQYRSEVMHRATPPPATVSEFVGDPRRGNQENPPLRSKFNTSQEATRAWQSLWGLFCYVRWILLCFFCLTPTCTTNPTSGFTPRHVTQVHPSHQPPPPPPNTTICAICTCSITSSVRHWFRHLAHYPPLSKSSPQLVAVEKPIASHFLQTQTLAQ